MTQPQDARPADSARRSPPRTARGLCGGLPGDCRREHAWRIMRAALRAVDPSNAVRRHLQRQEDRLVVTGANGELAYDLRDCERVFVVGAGKAGAPMAEAAATVLGERLTAGTVIVKYGHAGESGGRGRVEMVEAGHPMPDAAGLRGAQRLAGLLRQATERDLVICLLSGGGSALMTLPVPGVTLADLQSLTRSAAGLRRHHQ